MEFCHFYHILIYLVIYLGRLTSGLWWIKSLIENRVKIRCYDEFGCFDTLYPYNTSDAFLPYSPESLGVGFHVFNRSLWSERFDWNASEAELENFIVPGIETKLLIHGFQDHGRTPWIIKMASEFVQSGEKLNLLSLCWKEGSSPIIYSQAVANSRLVSVIATRFIQTLVHVGVQPGQIHLIGHSLGAHIAGSIGALLQPEIHIFRITGLDPAAPLFEGNPRRARLDETDARFVDVVHTYTNPIVTLGGNTVGVGVLQRSGTVDFYPNGGIQQRGCPVSLFSQLISLFSYGAPDWKALKRSFGCSHLRALDLFTESINSNCTYDMYFCWSNLDVSSSSCAPCHNMNCPEFGLRSVNSGFNGVFFFSTNEHSPFCST